MHYAQELTRRAAEGRLIEVAIVGGGRFGTSVAAQVGQMPGLRLTTVCDIRPFNAREALKAAGWAEEQIVEINSPAAAIDAIRAGRAVVSGDPLVAAHGSASAVVEVTGVPHVAAQTVSEALTHGKHVVNVTVEADVLLGALFVRLAEQYGVVYSVADGDQPGVTRRLIEWARTLGYRVIAAGRGTRFHPSDADGQPEGAFQRYGYSEELVQRRRFNPQMYNSFRDGSKAQIEMTSLANMAGLVPDVRGMHQPSAGIGDLARLFCPQADGGLLAGEGVVELANGVAADGVSLLADQLINGVFVVLGTDNPLLAEDLTLWGLPGHAGKYAALYRPFHLCGIETPLSIVDAVLVGRPTGAPLPVPLADCVAVAKHDLTAGELLDGSGGKLLVGQIEKASLVRQQWLLPLGLAYNAPLRRAIPAGQVLTYDDVELDETALHVRLRRQMDALIAPALVADG